MTFRHLLFALFLCGSAGLSAQTYRVTETSTTMDKASMTAAAVEIEAPRERVEELAVEYLENRFGIDLDRKNKEKQFVTWQADQIEITELNNGQIDLWLKVAALGDDRTNLLLSASRGYNNSISSAGDARGFRNLETITDNLTNYIYQKYYNNQLDQMNERVEEAVEQREDLTKDNTKLAKDITDKEKEIIELQQEIEAARKQIVENESALEQLAPQIVTLQTEQNTLQTKAQQWGEPVDPKKIRKRRKRSK